jgi:hypothetical protein
MVNIEKLRVMTDLAFYRKAQKKDITQGAEYYRGDYISRRIVRNLVGYTICYAAILGLVLLCSMDTLLNTFELNVIIDLFKVYVIYYLIGLFIFEVITFCTYFYRYNRTQRAVSLYRAMLKKLIRMQGQN